MATLYNQYIYKNGAWMKIGTSSDSVTYTLSYSALTGLLTLTGSDGSTSTVTIESGSSDAITGITVNGTTVTVTDGVAAISVPTTLSAFTNDVGYITSYTETDPVFRASAAAGITATDISNWNAKSDTDEKVKQENVTSGTYSILLGASFSSGTTTTSVNKAQLLSYNVSSNRLNVNNIQVGTVSQSGTIMLGGVALIGIRSSSGLVDNTVTLPAATGTVALTSNTPA